MIEGKVSEPFGKMVVDWRGENPSDGKRYRLDYLLNLLKLKEEDTLEKRYQLLHRTASAIIEAKLTNSKNALMLVHTFSKTGKWFDDYASFVELFKLTAKKDAIVGPVAIEGIKLYFGWVTGEALSEM